MVDVVVLVEPVTIPPNVFNITASKEGIVVTDNDPQPLFPLHRDDSQGEPSSYPQVGGYPAVGAMSPGVGGVGSDRSDGGGFGRVSSSRVTMIVAGVAAAVAVVIAAVLAFGGGPSRDTAAAPNARQPIASPGAASGRDQPEPSAEVALPVTFETMRDLVTSYYGGLPAGAQQAFSRLSRAEAAHVGYQSFMDFWSSVGTVTLLDVAPRNASSVVAHLHYVMPDGRTDTEYRWLSVISEEGVLKIDGTDRIGEG